MFPSFFFFNDPATTAIYTLSLHDALPIWRRLAVGAQMVAKLISKLSSHRRTRITLEVRESNLHAQHDARSEEHTSELQSRGHLVCRLLLEKKKNINPNK